MPIPTEQGEESNKAFGFYDIDDWSLHQNISITKPYVGCFIGMHVLLGMALGIQPKMAKEVAAVDYFKSQMAVFYLKLGRGISSNEIEIFYGEITILIYRSIIY